MKRRGASRRLAAWRMTAMTTAYTSTGGLQTRLTAELLVFETWSRLELSSPWSIEAGAACLLVDPVVPGVADSVAPDGNSPSKRVDAAAPCGHPRAAHTASGLSLTQLY